MIHRTIDAIRAWRAGCEGTVGLVPTMGDLHQGHLSLMRLAAQRCDHVVASVFVNPAQFGPGEDFEDYPRALDADARACQEVGVEAIFAPSDDEIYAPDHLTVVTVPQMTDHLCGAHRPGHFDGVATIVTKLFHITSPDVAVFGQKDYQQLAMIRRMARDLNFPVEILGGGPRCASPTGWRCPRAIATWRASSASRRGRSRVDSRRPGAPGMMGSARSRRC